MKKFLLTLVTVFVLVSMISVDSAEAKKKGKRSKAVSGNQVCIEAGMQIPEEDFGLETGYGLAFTYYHRLTNSIFFSASIGYHSFALENTGDYDFSFISMPMTLGGRYNFTTSGIQPYVGAEVGLFLGDITGEDVDIDSETELGFIVKGGIRYPLSPGLDLDINLKYNVIMPEGSDENSTYIGINFGIAYTIKR